MDYHQIRQIHHIKAPSWSCWHGLSNRQSGRYYWAQKANRRATMVVKASQIKSIIYLYCFPIENAPTFHVMGIYLLAILKPLWGSPWWSRRAPHLGLPLQVLGFWHRPWQSFGCGSNFKNPQERMNNKNGNQKRLSGSSILIVTRWHMTAFQITKSIEDTVKSFGSYLQSVTLLLLEDHLIVASWTSHDGRFL